MSYEISRYLNNHGLDLLVKTEEQSHIFDLGCGTGHPVSEYFIESGHQTTGVDFSPNILWVARKSFPNQGWIIRVYPLKNTHIL